MKVEVLANHLKNAIDEVWARYGKNISVNSLVYAKEEYGLFQRQEIKEILDSISALKVRLDDLNRECMSIPLDMKENQIQTKSSSC